MNESDEAPGSRQAQSSEMKRTLVIAAAILIAGAMAGGAILYVSIQGRPKVVETTSAQEAYEYASAGWRCEVPTDEGLKPINSEVLKILAQGENGADMGDLWDADAPARCTEPP